MNKTTQSMHKTHLNQFQKHQKQDFKVFRKVCYLHKGRKRMPVCVNNNKKNPLEHKSAKVELCVCDP